MKIPNSHFNPFLLLGAYETLIKQGKLDTVTVPQDSLS